MLLLCLLYEDEMKSNCDLLWLSENREKHLPLSININQMIEYYYAFQNTKE